MKLFRLSSITVSSSPCTHITSSIIKGVIQQNYLFSECQGQPAPYFGVLQRKLLWNDRKKLRLESKQSEILDVDIADCEVAGGHV